jgi:hypothetical protein
MEQIWNKDLQTFLPIEHEITFTNASKAAALLNYKRIVSAKDLNISLNVPFHIEPSHVVVPPNSKVPVRFLYRPIDLKTFDAQVQLQTNTSIDLINIPFNVQFYTPILQTRPGLLIDIGLIQTGKVFKEKMLILKNIGRKELRFGISNPRQQKSFVKQAFLQESGSQTASSSINQPLRIDPDQLRTFNIIIECENIDMNSMSDIVGLVEFELTSLCDPVIHINGTLINRTVTILIIGHTRPLPEFALPNESNSKVWSDLTLLPSSWLHRICLEHSIHISYTPLVMLTAIAHVCGLQKTENSLPITKEDWSTFCKNLHLDATRNNQDKLTIDQFDNETNVSKATDTLIKLLRSSLTNSVMPPSGNESRDSSVNIPIVDNF